MKINVGGADFDVLFSRSRASPSACGERRDPGPSDQIERVCFSIGQNVVRKPGCDVRLRVYARMVPIGRGQPETGNTPVGGLGYKQTNLPTNGDFFVHGAVIRGVD